MQHINYYIISHNLDLIKEYYVPSNYTHNIIVGQNCVRDKPVNCIVCNQLYDNIENYPYLCSYTGWYALVKNNICDSKHIISLLEYDITTHTNFHSYNIDTINKQIDGNYIIGYNKTFTDHYVFYKSTPWLEIALYKVYGIDLSNFVRVYKNDYPFWPTTTNFTMPVKILQNFIEWLSPMCDIFKHDPLGSYVHERAFFIYCILNNIRIIYAPDHLLQHHQVQSHKIQDIYGQILEKYNTSRLDSHMISEYDKTYNNSLNKQLMLHHQTQN